MNNFKFANLAFIAFACSLLLSLSLFSQGYNMNMNMNAGMGMQGNYWGSGMMGASQGCMSDVSAFDQLDDEAQEAVESIEDSTEEVANLKGEVKDLNSELRDLKKEDSIKALSPGILEAIDLRAAPSGILRPKVDSKTGKIEFEIDEDADYVELGSMRKCNEFISKEAHDGISNVSNAFSNGTDMIDSFGKLNSEKVDSFCSSSTEDAKKAQSIEGFNTTFATICKLNSSTGNYTVNSETFATQDYWDIQGKLNGFASTYAPLPDLTDGIFKNGLCKDDGINSSIACGRVSPGLRSDCIDRLNDYFEAKKKSYVAESTYKNLKSALKTSKTKLKKYIKKTEGDYCEDCAFSGYRRKSQGPSTGEMLFGAGMGLLGQYIGTRAYKSSQRYAIDKAAKLGYTMNPTPSHQLYADLGLSTVAAISGIASGAYLCADGGMGGGGYGFQNPYAMQMNMMGQGGAMGYPWGSSMQNPYGMYAPGNWGSMGQMGGLHTPFQMMGQMSPYASMMGSPYGNMMGPMSMFNPMSGMGQMGIGMQGGMNPFGMMSPYAMSNPFGALSGTAGFGPFANNPSFMMNPSLYGGGNQGLMSCIQAPCPGQLFNPYNGNANLSLNGGGNAQLQLQQIQQQMQMLQQYQQQQMAYYQQVQADAQRKMQVAQQLSQLQQQMAQLQAQAQSLYSQIGGGTSYGSTSFPGIGTGIGIGGGFDFNASLGLNSAWGYPYTVGIGNLSPNSPTATGTNFRGGSR